MTTEEDVLYYAEYVIKNNHLSHIYLRDTDIALISEPNIVNNHDSYRTLFGAILVEETLHNGYYGIQSVETMLKDIPPNLKKKKEYIGSLPSENNGKWIKTS
jgi:hypothetical protein